MHLVGIYIQSGPKNLIHSLLINIFGINLNVKLRCQKVKYGWNYSPSLPGLPAMHRKMFTFHIIVHTNKVSFPVNNSKQMHKSQSLFYLTTALHVSGVTITHLQEHKTTVTTEPGNRYTVLLSAAIVEELELV